MMLMLYLKKNPEFRRLRAGLAALAAVLLIAPSAGAANVIVQLRNGDRITGELIAQETNCVVIATSWAGTLAVPIATIGGVQTVSGEKITVTPAPAPAPTPAKVVAAATPAAAPAKPAPKPTPPKRFRTNMQLGSNLAFGARDSQTLYTRVKSTYEKPFASEAKKFFRTTADYTADYGKTEGVESANRMGGGVKSDLDFGQRSYAYGAGNVGYDEIRRIDLLYEVGPGLGVHLIKKPTFTLNVESGLNYQAQKRATGQNLDSVYVRFGEDVTWKISSRLSLTKKFEFFLDGEDTDQYRFRLDSNLSYKLIDNLTLNLTVLDTFDTQPAARVNKNELQIRSAIGITF
jgi:putative salt-induced outer membrane protein YdiY